MRLHCPGHHPGLRYCPGGRDSIHSGELSGRWRPGGPVRRAFDNRRAVSLGHCAGLARRGPRRQRGGLMAILRYGEYRDPLAILEWRESKTCAGCCFLKVEQFLGTRKFSCRRGTCRAATDMAEMKRCRSYAEHESQVPPSKKQLMKKRNKR